MGLWRRDPEEGPDKSLPARHQELLETIERGGQTHRSEETTSATTLADTLPPAVPPRPLTGSALDSLKSFSLISPSDRLSIDPSWRILFGFTSASIVGFALGASYGGTTSGYRFRAENAHRLPKSQKGWFFYHKTKNYHVAVGAAKEGIKMGLRLGFWTGAFLIAEVAVDGLRAPEGKDALGSVVAAAGTAGAWSVWNRLSIHTWARTTKVGIVAGLGYGLAQDALGAARGRDIGYVNYLSRRLGRSETEPTE